MNTENEQQLTIQQVAEITDLSVHTLRYYERIGLIHPINRAQNTHRRYSLDDVGWIEFLKKLRATGMSIQQMQRYAELQREGDPTLPERVEMLRALKEEAEMRISDLEENLKLIRYKIGFYQTIVDEQTLEAIPQI
ncbi:MAG: MerR family transcriptional regulator [Anaerolineaceae bacterium]|nr:MerR family transcriptional regulator [Anaerolineaceae bacterium]